MLLACIMLLACMHVGLTIHFTGPSVRETASVVPLTTPVVDYPQQSSLCSNPSHLQESMHWWTRETNLWKGLATKEP